MVIIKLPHLPRPINYLFFHTAYLIPINGLHLQILLFIIVIKILENQHKLLQYLCTIF